MAEASIPVDLLNPGQVFACLGLMEAAEILVGDAEGGFDWSGPRVRFTLSAAGDEDPIARVLDALRTATVKALAPRGSNLAAKEPGIETIAESDGDGEDGFAFPCPIPDTPSALPCRLQVAGGGPTIPISHWVDRSSVGLDNVKFWAGMAGYSGAALVRDLLHQVRGFEDASWPAVRADPFGVDDRTSASALQSSNLRFDYRAGTIPFDAGFSTNSHGHYAMVGYPLVDVLAAIGLEYARPVRSDPRDKLNYRYGAWGARVPPLFARPMLGCTDIGFPIRIFCMELGWPGQEGQARAIKSTREEGNP